MSRKLMCRVLKLLYNLNDNIEGNPTTAHHVSYRHKRNVQKDNSDATKTDSNDLRFGPQDDGFFDSDIGVVVGKGVKVAMDFLNTDKVIVCSCWKTKIKRKKMKKRKKNEDDEQEKEEEEGDEEKEIVKDEDDKGENDEVCVLSKPYMQMVIYIMIN
ncbi:hypothetical protein TIFTF001_028014 [Ficus carica]|uniref:Uncharacterized protein n=1 Tax=Ficus carica TaxID=3494 RepID=A0AA88DP56_FICCA|nr:hypothetical protein TIFTF001_028014 [Ficus carica]